MRRFIFRNNILIVRLLCKGFERVANKMKLLYGTGNLAKLSAMRNRLEQLDIELIGLNDLRAEGKIIPEVIEDGNTPLENARLKAMAYYEAFQIPVFSCDSGLYFDNVPNEVQPGIHVRNVNGKCLSDDEILLFRIGKSIWKSCGKVQECNLFCNG